MLTHLLWGWQLVSSSVAISFFKFKWAFLVLHTVLLYRELLCQNVFPMIMEQAGGNDRACFGHKKSVTCKSSSFSDEEVC